MPKPIVAAVLALALTACSDLADPPGPGWMRLEQGAPPAAAPGLMLVDTLAVRVRDSRGDRSGQLVRWSVRQGGGTVVPLSDTTDANGIARARWTLGHYAGLNVVEARTLEDSSIVFHTEGRAFQVDRLDSDYGTGCGLVSGDLWCWGQYAWIRNEPVSQGMTESYPLEMYAPGKVAGGLGFTDLAVEWPGACALDRDAIVHCYGSFAIPELPSVPALRMLVAGNTFCGLARSDSTAWCWDAVTGDGRQISDTMVFIDLSMSDYIYRACGLRADSTAACWGWDPVTRADVTVPEPVPGGLHFAHLAMSADFTCGLQASGDAWCWGLNDYGQLGSAGPASAVPVLARSGVSRLAARIGTAMARQYGGFIRWGQFDGSYFNEEITGLEGLPFSDFAVSDFSCLRLVDGQVYCYDELWDNSSALEVYNYSAVSPAP